MNDGKNPINRYIINSPMLPDLKKHADGSLTLYIQNASPGSDKESNGSPGATARSTCCALLAEVRTRRQVSPLGSAALPNGW